MRLMGQALLGALVCLASGLACAGGLQWVAKDARGTPVVAGGSDALPFHVCRVALEGGATMLGKFWTGGDRGGECRYAADGREQGATSYEMLVETDIEASYAWVPGHATSYPQRSVVGGSAVDGERLLVCAAVDPADGSLHPGYIYDWNCVYGNSGAQLEADTYLVLATNDASVAATEEAQPAQEGFDPGAILAGAGVAALCAKKDGACLRTLPDNF